MLLEYTPEFSEALQKLHNGENMFLTGKAGTGKSTLIREFIGATTRKVSVTAATGIAALNIDGKTVHSFLGLRPSTTLADIADGTFKPSRDRLAMIKRTDTLIIDEASMIRADLFDKIATVLKLHGPLPGAKFGGVQIVLVGDLYQLPPVVRSVEEEYFRTEYETKFFFSAHEYSRSQIPPLQLTKVFRQAGDPELTELLNAVRDGLATTEVQDAVNQRVRKGFEPPSDEFWLTLTTRNNIAAARNSDRLSNLPGPAARSVAVIEGDVRDDEYPNDEVVEYKAGAQIMMITNDPAGRWVNGTLGTVTKITSSGRTQVKLHSGETVRVDPYQWKTEKAVLRDGSIHRETTGTFIQVPFRLAWAITIHKSQGQTLDRMVVDLAGGSFDSGQTYVALSRARSLQGIVLTQPVKPSDLKIDPRVVRFLSSRSGTAATASRCAIAVSTIGEDYFADKARPVEIGIAFEDGTGMSTILNPGRDPGDALTKYGLSNDALLLAPTLGEAWTVIESFVAGHTPVGYEIDRVREVLDHEFKRIGRPIHLPLGTEVPRQIAGTRPRTSLDQAFEDLRQAQNIPIDQAAELFSNHSNTSNGVGFMLSRDYRSYDAPKFGSATATAILTQSMAVSEVALHTEPALHTLPSGFATSGVVAGAIVNRLRQTIGQSGRLSPDLANRVSRLEGFLDARLLDETNISDANIHVILHEGASVCFTGESVLPDGGTISKRELYSIAGRCGLNVVKSVTKRGCNVLVAAQMGTQSGKAKSANKFAIPIVSSEEFLEWAATRQPLTDPDPWA